LLRGGCKGDAGIAYAVITEKRLCNNTNNKEKRVAFGPNCNPHFNKQKNKTTTSMNILTNKKVAIVGGGPGGLTLARLLQLKGITVQVYERDLHKDARSPGATLDLHDNSGLLALREAGLMDAFRANYRRGADKFRIVDKNARILLEDDIDNGEDLLRPEIDRGPLQQILLDSLQPGTVVWDSQFTTLAPKGEGWKLTFKNGLSVVADFVIAADGANSKLRPYVTPIKPFFAGVTAIESAVYHSETTIPEMHRLLNGGKIFGLDDSKTLIVSSKGDGSLMFYTGFKTTENWSRDCGIDFSDKAQVLAWFRETFTGWDEIWLQLFEHASTSFMPRPQYCMPLEQTWVAQPNITLLGDAAHLMPPYAGEGVNMAMLDALELSQCLTGGDFPDLHSAIAAYEMHMRSRASEAAHDTLVSTDALHAPDAIDFFRKIVG
jgi:2-polyprenyl-6-methoxyphenol hydroxylase-like FAD-dependent oxidoreductase